MDIKKKVSTICEDRLQQCLEFSKIDSNDFAYMRSLNQRRAQLINEINTIFDKMIEETRKTR